MHDRWKMEACVEENSKKWGILKFLIKNNRSRETEIKLRSRCFPSVGRSKEALERDLG